MKQNVIAIFDIGKTNKKLFLFDEQYHVLFETSTTLREIQDEDGFACEDISALTQWMKQALEKALSDNTFHIKAINFSAYGASFVLMDENGKVAAPLYNYLKPYPEELLNNFYSCYGSKESIAVETASPALGSLNSGMQLYRLKQEKPQLFHIIKYALHFPQYLSWLITQKYYADVTSIGCHTQLWDFKNNQYHQWVVDEKIDEKLAPVYPSDKTIKGSYNGHEILCGIGLHDSSAALIPYLMNFREPFVLLSTGTWCISLNPFNTTPLTGTELSNDCLCYMSYTGDPVKASRLFAGHEHEVIIKKLAAHFNVDAGYYRQVAFDASLVPGIELLQQNRHVQVGIHPSAFSSRAISSFNSYEQAYHQCMYDIMVQQKTSTSFITGENITRIFVDGGFSKNDVYMNLLALTFPGIEVFAASIPQSTARGAALAIHQQWNTRPVPSNLIDLKLYAGTYSESYK